MAKSNTEQLVEKIEKFAETAVLEFPGLGLFIEHDLRGKHRSLVIRVGPAVTKKRTGKGQS